MKIVYQIIILCSLILGTVTAQAQTISGQLTDTQNQPMAYANIVLQTTDSTFVTGTTSGEKGEFKLQKVAAGNYRLVITNLGYQTLYVDLQGFERSANVGTLTIAEASQLLNEVTVTASSMFSNSDKKVVFPNKKQVNSSNNGVDLLRNLMLPRLKINPMDGSVDMIDGGTVQLSINGRKATKEEVTALLPNEIIRVEFLENPGLRYGSAAAVVNYVVRRYDVGGSFGYDGTQSLKSGFGNHNVSSKLNFGKSEISLRYGNRLQYFNDLWYDKTETFSFEDGKEYHRVQHAETDGKKNIQQWGALTYNVQDGEKYMLNVTAGFSHFLDPNLHTMGKLYTEEYPNSVTDRQEKMHSRNLSPYFDIYFQKNLKHKQFIALNAVGTYINTQNRSNYAEYLNNESVVDFYSGVRGKKYSLIAEGIYEKGFNNNSQLSAGIRHTQGYTDNEYDGTLQYNTQMKQADTYAYAQYGGKWKKLGYRIGLGITRSLLRQEGEDDYETWSLNPRLNVNYNFNDNWSASLEGNVSTANPSLSQLSKVDQLMDSLQLNRGNPDLKSYSQYSTTFRLNYNKGKWFIGAFNRYNYYDNVIMTQVYREDNKFVHGYANHRNYRQWFVGLDARVGMLWDMLQLGGGIYSDKRWSNGLDYSHTHHSIGWTLSATLMYKNFTATALYNQGTDNLFGESLNTGEEAHLIVLQYRLKSLNLGLQMFNPFQKDYARLESSKNKYAGFENNYHIDDIARMMCVTVSWNFNFGRNFKSGSKKMQNSDTDSGIMK